jgi:solute carrier family 6 GABA transporter-like protein 1
MNDPLHVMGFIIAHFLLLWVVLGFVMPRWLDIFIIPERRDDWKQRIAPCVPRDAIEGDTANGMEFASPSDSIHEAKPTAVPKDARSDHINNDGLNDSNNSPLFPDHPKRQY